MASAVVSWAVSRAISGTIPGAISGAISGVMPVQTSSKPRLAGLLWGGKLGFDQTGGEL